MPNLLWLPTPFFDSRSPGCQLKVSCAAAPRAGYLDNFCSFHYASWSPSPGRLGLAAPITYALCLRGCCQRFRSSGTFCCTTRRQFAISRLFFGLADVQLLRGSCGGKHRYKYAAALPLRLAVFATFCKKDSTLVAMRRFGDASRLCHAESADFGGSTRQSLRNHASEDKALQRAMFPRS